MSLKSAIVMYRVDGVSGLKCLTGINTKVFSTATLKLAGHHSCPCWESVIGPQTCCPAGLSGDEERVNYQTQNEMQAIFKRILGGFNRTKAGESRGTDAPQTLRLDPAGPQRGVELINRG